MALNIGPYTSQKIMFIYKSSDLHRFLFMVMIRGSSQVRKILKISWTWYKVYGDVLTNIVKQVFIRPLQFPHIGSEGNFFFFFLVIYLYVIFYFCLHIKHALVQMVKSSAWNILLRRWRQRFTVICGSIHLRIYTHRLLRIYTDIIRVIYLTTKHFFFTIIW